MPWFPLAHLGTHVILNRQKCLRTRHQTPSVGCKQMNTSSYRSSKHIKSPLVIHCCVHPAQGNCFSPMNPDCRRCSCPFVIPAHGEYVFKYSLLWGCYTFGVASKSKLPFLNFKLSLPSQKRRKMEKLYWAMLSWGKIFFLLADLLYFSKIKIVHYLKYIKSIYISSVYEKDN